MYSVEVFVLGLAAQNLVIYTEVKSYADLTFVSDKGKQVNSLHYPRFGSVRLAASLQRHQLDFGR